MDAALQYPVTKYSISLQAKPSFAWKHFGSLILKTDTNNKRTSVATDKVFCNICLQIALDKDGEDENNSSFLENMAIFQMPKLPDRTTLSRSGLDDVYLSMICQQINVGPKFCAITFDMWTDKYRRRNYITFTFHEIDNNFNIVFYTLATHHVTQKHTAETILSEIEKVENEFDLGSKKIQMVTDAGPSVKKSVRLGEYDHHLCLGHGLHNLVTVDGIKKVNKIENLIKKVREVIVALRFKTADFENINDIENRKCFESISYTSDILDLDDNDLFYEDRLGYDDDSENQKSYEKKHKTLKLNVPTRWHSILIILESVTGNNKNPINILLNRMEKPDLKLFNSDWDLVYELLNFLKTFKQTVEFLSVQKGVTTNLALLFRSEIKNHLIVLGALLDSRFQSINIVNEYLKEKNITPVKFLCQHATSLRSYTDELNKCKTTEVASKLDYLKSLATKHSSIQNNNLEQQHYLTSLEKECYSLFSPYNLEIKDVLNFWKIRALDLPKLSILARKVLCVPATSTPSERIKNM
ncbi:uncharacterized protein LOC135926698 [Gordionus sp. m RMFG-2023]|uniref:uncharacterized protein LOC135926698 n=1 Tax=Gordionus sp. m RMFG-2023 TaxID=3053472 RepID=UPI0031FBF65F